MHLTGSQKSGLCTRNSFLLESPPALDPGVSCQPLAPSPLDPDLVRVAIPLTQTMLLVAEEE